jgi:hypothetical protein
VAGKDYFSLRENGFKPLDLERLEERLEMQYLSVIQDEYCNLHICTADCSEGTWCAGGFCPCDGSLCFCHGDCPSHCPDYCTDGGGW